MFGWWHVLTYVTGESCRTEQESDCKSGWTDCDAVQDVDSGGSKKHVLDGVQIPTCEGAILRAKKAPAQDMPRCVGQLIYSKQVSRRQHQYGADTDLGVRDGSGHWHCLANTTELSMCSSNVSLYEITLTTCTWLISVMSTWMGLAYQLDPGWHCKTQL